MRIYYKRLLIYLTSLCLLTLSCLDYEYHSEPEGFTPESKAIIDRILAENNTEEYTVEILTKGISDGMAGTAPTGYRLGIKVDKIIVLTNTLDSLRLYGIYRESMSKYYGSTGGMKDLKLSGIRVICDTLDSICIITDSVIALPSIYLGSNLTHLPPEIGKLRVNSLDVSYNKIKDLPLEIMQLLNSPKYYPYTRINLNGLPDFYFDSLPDTLKNWFSNVYSKQNFEDEY